jgi:glycosyltransferase involved in cell wall biosynthesis
MMPLAASDRSRTPMLSVVVPLHNEAEGVRATLAGILDELRRLGAPFEIVAVDDGSTDATWTILTEVAAQTPGVRGLRLSRRFGKEAALCAGLAAAGGDVAVTIDGDLQHPPQVIAHMLDAWRQGADIVDGVKLSDGSASPVERLRANVFYGLLRRLSGYDLRGASDFKLLDRRALDAYLTLPERNVFYRGMAAWLGFQRAAVSFEVARRAAGGTKWGLKSLVKLALTAVTSFSTLPLQLITTLGFAFLLFALVMGVQTLYRKLSGSALDGFTTVILLLLIIGSAIMIGLGVIGAYVARIYDEVKGRPRFVVAETVGDRSA